MKTAYTNGKILNGHEDMTPVTGLAVLVDGDSITGVIPDGGTGRTGTGSFPVNKELL